jgi:hypothetical protein
MSRFSNHSFIQQLPSPCNDPLLFVIPSVLGFPASLLSPATTDVVLSKENHTQLTEAATLDRKSGEAEGSAVRHSCAPPLPASARHQSATLSSSKERAVAEPKHFSNLISIGLKFSRLCGTGRSFVHIACNSLEFPQMVTALSFTDGLNYAFDAESSQPARSVDDPERSV